MSAPTPATSTAHALLHISAPRNFSFWRTVQSHGWCDLLPFSRNVETRTLHRLLRLQGAFPAYCQLSPRGDLIRIHVSSPSRLHAAQRKEILHQLRSCLRLDEDFSAFHAAARRHPSYRWISRRGAGRLLRAPTVFEDVVKMICTTNCSWALTKIMVTKIVERFGELFGEGLHTFPTPEALAAATEGELRKECTTGYRSPYLLELAERVASGKLAIEEWRTGRIATDELYRRVRSVQGVGPYAAGNILKLLGRYDYLGLDTWVRGRYTELHTRGRKVKDSTIERAYARFGPWRGLFFWLEMTRDWHL